MNLCDEYADIVSSVQRTTLGCRTAEYAAALFLNGGEDINRKKAQFFEKSAYSLLGG
jgi:hypothetical protein